MKVKIGKYKNFPSIGDFERFLEYLGVREDIADKIGEAIFNCKPFMKIFNSLEEWWFRDGYRDVDVDISYDDLWSGDLTLSYILIPFLKEFKEKSDCSYPCSDEITCHEDWLKLIDKMIWSFEQIVNSDWREEYTIEPAEIDFENDLPYDENGCRPLKWKTHGKYDWDGIKAHDTRIQEGCELFGKYFRNIWI